MNERMRKFVNSGAGTSTNFVLASMLGLGSACVSSLLYIGRIFPFQPFALQWPLSIALVGIPYGLLKRLQKFENDPSQSAGDVVNNVGTQPEKPVEAQILRRAKLIFAATEMIILASLIMSVSSNLFPLAIFVYLFHLVVTIAAVRAGAQTWSRFRRPPLSLALLINLPMLGLAAIIGAFATL